MEELNYSPSSIDAADVVLPKSLESFLEALAENVHENWARDSSS